MQKGSEGVCFHSSSDQLRGENTCLDPEPSQLNAALLEQLCLAARVRAAQSSSCEVLVLQYATASEQLSAREHSTPLSRVEEGSAQPVSDAVEELCVGSYHISVLYLLPDTVLQAGQLRQALFAGFHRLYLELPPDVSRVGEQLSLIETVSRHSNDGKFAGLFHSFGALMTALKEECATIAHFEEHGRSEFHWHSRQAMTHQHSHRESWHGRNAQEFRARVEVSGNACSLCGLCSWVCPEGALRLSGSGNALVVHDEVCVGCGICVMACNENALELQNEDDTLASETLILSGTF